MTSPEDDSSRCHTAALRLLNYRWNSEVELRRKLARKKFERPVIDATLQRLREEGWLDDERFAGAYVSARLRKNIGPQRLRRELIEAGVDDEIAGRAVRENVDAERSEAGVLALCQKKMRMIARRYGVEYLRTDQGRKKLAAYLLNQGYDAALVFQTIDKCMKLRSA